MPVPVWMAIIAAVGVILDAIDDQVRGQVERKVKEMPQPVLIALIGLVGRTIAIAVKKSKK